MAALALSCKSAPQSIGWTPRPAGARRRRPALDIAQELAQHRPEGPTAVTLGVFDGVHLGHRHLLRRLKHAAEERELIPAVVTLANHPVSVLRPGTPIVLLTTFADRVDLIREAGIPHVVPLTFSKELSLFSAEQFMALLCETLGVRHFVAGPDFALGHDREGTIDVLRAIGGRLGYTAEAVEPLLLEGAPVSSSRIRQALSTGDVEEAARLLGRPFSLAGPVVEGEGRGGGLLGFPTANLGLGPLQALPADGIYAAWAIVNGKRYASATSVGTKPTFHDEGPRVVEAFLLDFAGNLYAEQVRVEFVKWLRPQERFADVDALVKQIEADVRQTRTVLSESLTYRQSHPL